MFLELAALRLCPMKVLHCFNVEGANMAPGQDGDRYASFAEMELALTAATADKNPAKQNVRY